MRMSNPLGWGHISGNWDHILSKKLYVCLEMTLEGPNLSLFIQTHALLKQEAKI